MDSRQTMNVLEACLLAAGRPLRIAELEALFDGDGDARPDRAAIRQALAELAATLEGRGIELVEVAGGWRLQTRTAMAPWVARLFEERPPRYSRALLETLVLIAYRQPITRGEIEAVRGVAVSSTIVRTLQERGWIREVGHKDVPGRPALLGTTSAFLDYFNLRRLDDLPPLEALKDLDSLEAALAAEIGMVEAPSGEAANEAGSDEGRESAGAPGTEGIPPDASVSVAGAAPDASEPLAVPAATEGATDATRAPETGVAVPAAEAANDATVDGPAGEPVEAFPNPSSGTASEGPSGAGTADDAAADDAAPPSADAAEEGAGAPVTDETPQAAMLRSVEAFADEHRRELERREALERRALSRPLVRTVGARRVALVVDDEDGGAGEGEDGASPPRAPERADDGPPRETPDGEP